MQFDISVLEADGSVKKINVEASSKEEALLKADIQEDRVVSIRKNYLSALTGILVSKAPNLETQAVFLQVLAGLISSGRPVFEAVTSLLKTMGSKVNAGNLDLKDQLEVSRILDSLKFDQSAVVLAQVGEESGRLSELLGVSAQNIMKRLGASSEMRKGMAMGAVYLLVGIAMLTVFPIYIAPQMHKIISHPKSNFASIS